MKREKRAPAPARKLSFQKKSFRVLDDKELNQVKGGDGEMVLNAEMVLSGSD
jgi:bacteriocin-like protein